MTTDYIRVPGGRLLVVDEGQGPPIVLLHAGIANLRSWDAMAPYLVAADYRVVRYDQRGFGETTTEAVPFSNRADVIALLDHLGIGRAALVGNSRGGVIALDTAAEFPDRIVAVVGVGAGLGGYDASATPEEMAAYDAMDALESAEPPDVPADRGRHGPVLGRRPGPARRSRPVRDPRGDPSPADRHPAAGPRQRRPDPARSADRSAPGQPHDADPRGRGRARRLGHDRHRATISRRPRPTLGPSSGTTSPTWSGWSSPNASRT